MHSLRSKKIFCNLVTMKKKKKIKTIMILSKNIFNIFLASNRMYLVILKMKVIMRLKKRINRL